MPQSYPFASKRGVRFRWGMGKKKRAKIAPLNRLPLLPSGPGGVQQELVVLTRRCKDSLEMLQNKLMTPIIFYCKHLVADYQSVRPSAYL